VQSAILAPQRPHVGSGVVVGDTFLQCIHVRTRLSGGYRLVEHEGMECKTKANTVVSVC
jgi:hypothetical protein